jgi:hypothetical protein
MLQHSTIPAAVGLRGPDRNIDHRRVPNLMRYFERHGKRVPPGAGYRAGDSSPGGLPNDLLHVGIVAERRARATLVVHNIGDGARSRTCSTPSTRSATIVGERSPRKTSGIGIGVRERLTGPGAHSAGHGRAGDRA